MRKYILTIATGKKSFTDMAANLARSFLWWHPDTDIIFKLITDNKSLLPPDIINAIEIVEIQPGAFGDGFSTKLNLDLLAGDGQTLFIDSDCLIFGKLDSLFDRFKSHDVSVVGSFIADGEWFGDISKICHKYNVPHIPKFNGGIYYLEKGQKADEVYATARQIETKYDEIGFVRLRDKPNDEVIMALAMQLHKQTPIADDGTIMSDPQACPGKYNIDIIKGVTYLINPPAPNKLHRNWYPFHKVSPVIVHFLGYYTYHYPYRREVFRLQKAIQGQQNWIINARAVISIEFPERLKTFSKTLLRPLFHFFFGIRKVKKSSRLS